MLHVDFSMMSIAINFYGVVPPKLSEPRGGYVDLVVK